MQTQDWVPSHRNSSSNERDPVSVHDLMIQLHVIKRDLEWIHKGFQERHDQMQKHFDNVVRQMEIRHQQDNIAIKDAFIRMDDKIRSIDDKLTHERDSRVATDRWYLVTLVGLLLAIVMSFLDINVGKIFG